MSFFSKMFGSKGSTDDSAAQAAGSDFLAALSMQLRGELEPALATYLRLAQENPDAPLAPFCAAAIRAAQGDSAQAAETLRTLSRDLAAKDENISRVIALELATQLGANPFLGSAAIAELVVSFGDLLKKEGFLREGAVCFEIAAGLVPDNANVLHKLGDTLHDLRMYDYAEAVLLEALKHAPYHWGAIYTYAVLLQDLGRDQDSILYYEKAVRLNPDHARCQNNYAAALLRTNQPEQALEHCNQAARLDPDSPLVKINLGNIYKLMQQYERARTCFAEAIALSDQLPQAYYGLASVEQALEGDPRQVRELYLKALAINPSIPEVHHALGNLLAGAGDPEALTHFSAALQLQGSLRNLERDFGSACLQLGRREEGLEHLRAALRQSPDDVSVLHLIAKAEGEK